MKIDGDLLKINGQKVIGLKAYRIGSNLLWKDAERNMNGDVRASYLGEYPKIELEFIDGLTQHRYIISLRSHFSMSPTTISELGKRLRRNIIVMIIAWSCLIKDEAYSKAFLLA